MIIKITTLFFVVLTISFNNPSRDNNIQGNQSKIEIFKEKLERNQLISYCNTAAYYWLFENSSNPIVINILLNRLFISYGRDASGDGGVSDIEYAIKQIESRISHSKK